jgi:REP element-mobilizing transposase RayT
MVVLPDHLHAIWTMPPGDADFATRRRLIKTGFSRRLPAGERISHSRVVKGERGIGQRRYWEHTIRDERDFARHVDCIHINPVKHGLVTRVRDWPHSSFHRMVKLGDYPEDRAGDLFRFRCCVRRAAAAANGKIKMMGIASLHPSYGLRPMLCWRCRLVTSISPYAPKELACGCGTLPATGKTITDIFP